MLQENINMTYQRPEGLSDKDYGLTDKEGYRLSDNQAQEILQLRLTEINWA